jgi:hypothetical protein
MRDSRPAQSAALALLVLAGWTALLLGAGRASGVPAADDHYDIVAWIGAHLPAKWLNPPARLLGGGARPATDSQLVSFFGETSALAAAETDVEYARALAQTNTAAEAAVSARLHDLQALQTPVALRLEQELSSVASHEGLDTALPLFSKLRLVWPPVDFAYDLPPYLLIVSRRDRIDLVSTTLLRSNLSDAQVQQIERSAERGGYSALVVRVGGVATYPSVVEEDDDYAGALDLIAHEWTHQYLFFHPLGVRYFASADLTTINETVANMTGAELAAAIRARFPLPAQPAVHHASAPPPDRAVNFDQTLHQLRLNVDALLAQGKVAQAEQQMNDTQRFLAQHGYYVGTINQAYFAFYGTYANTAASVNPIGPELAALRSRYATLGAFVHAVQNITSVADLQKLLHAQ